MRFFFIGPRFFGIRPRISLRASELLPRLNSSTVEGSFLYVAEGTHGLVKIGVSKNPSERLATLQTGSPFPLTMPYVAATPGEGFDIEQEAHHILSNSRVNGEWFSCRTDKAIAAVEEAAAQLRRPLLPASPQLVEDILTVARVPQQAMLPRAVRWTISAVLGVIIGTIIGIIGRIAS